MVHLQSEFNAGTYLIFIFLLLNLPSSETTMNLHLEIRLNIEIKNWLFPQVHSVNSLLNHQYNHNWTIERKNY